ncbi:MAG: hypothetical protein HYV07_20570 [Deltaproteobacteria bacterium]|nr:hypothetical protein [Deltaproteobacteria bacterium]
MSRELERSPVVRRALSRVSMSRRAVLALVLMTLSCSNREFIPVPGVDWRTEILAVGNETRVNGFVIDSAEPVAVSGSLTDDTAFEAVVYHESASELGLAVGRIGRVIKPAVTGVAFRFEGGQWQTVPEPGPLWTRLFDGCLPLPRTLNVSGCGTACQGTVSPRGECGFTIDSCGIAVDVDIARRSVSVHKPSGLLCDFGAEELEGSLFELECRACAIDFFPLDVPAIPLRQRTVVVAAPAAARPECAGTRCLALVDLAMARDRLVVVEHHCSFGTPSKLTFVEPETLAIVDTATAGPCLTRIVADPATDRVIAMGDDRLETWTAGRLASVVYADRSTTFKDLAINHSGSRLAAVDLWTGDLLILQASDLSLVGRVAVGLSSARVAAGPEDGFLVVGSGGWVTVVGTEVRSRVATGTGFPRDFAFDETSDLIVSATIDGIGTISESELTFRSPPLPGELAFLAPWPHGPSQFLVSHLDPNGGASVWIFDARSRSFVWGAHRVGQGRLGRMKTDKKGRVWALLPEEGKLIRLEPEEGE